MIIDSLLEFPASGDVIDLMSAGDAIGNELYFHVVGSGAFTLTTGDTTSGTGATLLSGTADEKFSARVPMGLKRYIKATFSGKCFLTHGPEVLYKDL